MKRRTRFISESSSRLMPMTETPFGPYSVASSTIMGYSARQGSHQVAQKLTTSGLPLYLAMMSLYPARSMSAGSATGLAAGWAALGDELGLWARPGKAVAMVSTAAMIAKMLFTGILSKDILAIGRKI